MFWLAAVVVVVFLVEVVVVFLVVVAGAAGAAVAARDVARDALRAGPGVTGAWLPPPRPRGRGGIAVVFCFGCVFLLEVLDWVLNWAR